MKTIVSYGIIFGLLMTLGCSKDDIDDNDSIDDTYYVRAKVGEYQKTLNAFPIISHSSDGYISVYGYKEEIGISLRIPDTIGAYAFQEGNFTGKLTFGDPWDFFDANGDGPPVDYSVISGNVTITHTLTAQGSYWELDNGELIISPDAEFEEASAQILGSTTDEPSHSGSTAWKGFYFDWKSSTSAYVDYIAYGFYKVTNSYNNDYFYIGNLL